MRSIKEIQSSIPHCVYAIDVPMRFVPEYVERYEIDLDPDYQRDYVWTPEQQRAFVGALIQNPHAMTPIILNDLTNGMTGASEIVDGKQRISAVRAWCDGKISAECPSGDVVHISELSDTDKRLLGVPTCMRWKWVRLNRSETLKYYLSLNGGGTIHTKEELDKVRRLLEGEKHGRQDD